MIMDDNITLTDFMNRYDFSLDPFKGCWIIMNRAPDSSGYITLSVNGKTERAHRFVYRIIHKEIPEGKIICHRCDNKLCVNPDHLYAGTRKDNTQDMLRNKKESRWKGTRKRRKLSRKDIEDIRNSDKGSYELSKIYPVTDVQIRRIRNGTRCQNI